MIYSITDQDFNDKISGSGKMVLVHFWAQWCGPCKLMAPALEDASEDLADMIDVYKIDIDDNPESPSRHGVRGIPTILFFKDGKEAFRQSGALPKSKLYDKIRDAYYKS